MQYRLFQGSNSEGTAHDFLWRVHAETPARGNVVVFNRSHYEDVLIVRVKRFVEEKVWKSRYNQINQFEQILTENGTVVLKFFLHISKKEQEKRLLEREADPTKVWKLSVEDWKNRELWEDYQAAYEDAVNLCSTKNAPWYVVPADQKWYRDLVITETIVEALRPYRKDWLAKLEKIGATAKSEIALFRKQ